MSLAASSQSFEPFRDCDTICPQMIEMPAGKFIMGSPVSEPGRYAQEAQHLVNLNTRFAVSKFAVTFSDWDACFNDGGCNGYWPSDMGWGRGNRPVININYADALAYTAWLSRKTGKSYRLLSEAEWEYAARGGTTTAYYWGDAGTGNKANCKNCGTEWDDRESSPVGSFPANAFGLYDMAGNVWTWTLDCWDPSYEGAPIDGKPRLRDSCPQRVLRGGAFDHEQDTLRAASRGGYDASVRDRSIGFRIARGF